jgi:hypothetical protein
VTVPRYQAYWGCAASAEWRGDVLAASAPPAGRWLLIESREPWPRDALTALRRPTGYAADDSLAAEVVRRCRALQCRPVLIRRYGRSDRTVPRRWALVESWPGRESVRWGDLPSDGHLLEVLAGKDPGLLSSEPVYLVCTHGRHDTCCAVRGRPAAEALAAAYPERTWECSHVGGDRFAANVVLLPHALFYGHVPQSRAVELVIRYDEGLVVPELLRGTGALAPPVQAAQHFARAAGSTLAVDSLRPVAVQELARQRWQVLMEDDGLDIEVVVAAELVTINGSMTCSSLPPGRVWQFELVGQVVKRANGSTRW